MKMQLKKIIPYVFILTILVGLLGPVVQVHAATDPNTVGTCSINGGVQMTLSKCNKFYPGAGFLPNATTPAPSTGTPQCYTANGFSVGSENVSTKEMCMYTNGKDASGGLTGEIWSAVPPTSGDVAAAVATGSTTGAVTITCTINGTNVPNTSISDCAAQGGTPVAGSSVMAPTQTASQSDFEKEINKNTCIVTGIFGSVAGCFVQISYYVFYVIAAFVLWLCAMLFNALIAISLSSKLFASSAFISSAWTVVRDLSNIFFILILIYVAVQTILGLGHDTKKVIVNVIIMALLINFSMFFTEVIIDTSNTLALVFYNKLDVNTKDSNGKVRDYSPSTQADKEQDISGGLVQAFDPTTLLTADFFKKAGTQQIPGKPAVAGPVSPGVLIGITIIAGAIMYVAAYAFFVSGLSFLGRMIELWILTIFSPFAFMSFSLPILENIEDIGWNAWFKKLIKVAFMAPIFMFFMYFIFLLIHSKIFVNFAGKDSTFFEGLLFILVPAFMIIILLKKATEYAKKGSGAVGDFLAKTGQLAFGAATGLAMGGVGVALQATAGQASSRLANSEWAKGRERRGEFGGAAFRRVAQYGATSSFDVRKGAMGGVLKAASDVTGVNFGHATKMLVKDGGFEADRKRAVENRMKRAKDLEVGEDEALQQEVRAREADVQTEKANPETQATLLRLNEGADHHESDAADAAVVAATTPAVLQPLQDLEEAKLVAMNNLAVANTALHAADANLAAHPIDPQAEAARKAAAANVTEAKTALATANANIENAQTLAAAFVTATNNLAVANTALHAADANLAAHPTDPQAKAARIAAAANVTVANTALATANTNMTGNQAAQVIGNRDMALSAQAATRGLGNLERAATTAQTELADAERNLKDAIAEHGTTSTQANTARLAQTRAIAERNRTARDVKNRQTDIRNAGSRLHHAEVALKRSQNAVTAENRARKMDYATVVETHLLPTLQFLYAGGARAQREAGNKIRAEIKPSDSGHGKGHGGGHGPSVLETLQIIDEVAEHTGGHGGSHPPAATPTPSGHGNGH